MAEAIVLCVPCKRRGLVNVAHRIVNGQGMCRECYEGKPVAPVTLAANPSNPVTIVRKEEPMRKANVDWNAVRTERAQGVTVRELAEKFHVSEANIYLHSRGKGKSRAGGGQEIEPFVSCCSRHEREQWSDWAAGGSLQQDLVAALARAAAANHSRTS